MRIHLGRVLEDLRADLDWSAAEAEEVGRRVLGDNARTLLAAVGG